MLEFHRLPFMPSGPAAHRSTLIFAHPAREFSAHGRSFRSIPPPLVEVCKRSPFSPIALPDLILRPPLPASSLNSLKKCKPWPLFAVHGLHFLPDSIFSASNRPAYLYLYDARHPAQGCIYSSYFLCKLPYTLIWSIAVTRSILG